MIDYRQKSVILQSALLWSAHRCVWCTVKWWNTLQHITSIHEQN